MPDDFDPPRELELPEFHLAPLGAQHNESDHAAWTSSIAHIRATPGFESWGWPPVEGMSLDANSDSVYWYEGDGEITDVIEDAEADGPIVFDHEDAHGSGVYRHRTRASSRRRGRRWSRTSSGSTGGPAGRPSPHCDPDWCAQRADIDESRAGSEWVNSLSTFRIAA